MKVTIELDEKALSTAISTALAKQKTTYGVIADGVREALGSEVGRVVGEMLSEPALQENLRAEVRQKLSAAIDTLVASYADWRVRAIVAEEASSVQYTGIVQPPTQGGT